MKVELKARRIGGVHHRQSVIESVNPDNENWDQTYVALHGFTGPYPPEMFAAAPELYEALAGLIAEIDDCAQPADWDFYEPAMAALAKARGENE